MSDEQAVRPREETMDVLFDISQLLQTGLDRETLTTLVGLTETGVNPEALAAVVKELRRESAALNAEATLPPQPPSNRSATEAAAFPAPRR
jgi:mitotic-spindle organizing protein 1